MLSVKVKVRQDQNDKPFVIECEAEGEPAPEWVQFLFLSPKVEVICAEYYFSKEEMNRKRKLDFELREQSLLMNRMNLTGSNEEIQTWYLSLESEQCPRSDIREKSWQAAEETIGFCMIDINDIWSIFDFLQITLFFKTLDDTMFQLWNKNHQKNE